MDSSLRQSADHLSLLRAHFDQAPTPNRSALGYRRLLAHYYNLLIPESASVLEVGCGGGELLALLRASKKTGVDLSTAQLARAKRLVPEAEFHAQAGEELNLPGTYDVIILSDTLNFAVDVQTLLERLTRVATPATRLIINYHNNVWRPIHTLAEWLGLRRPAHTSNWLSSGDIENLLELAGWESIKRQPRLLWPVPTPVVAPFLNRLAAPLLAPLNFALFEVARLRPQQQPVSRITKYA